MTNDHVCQNSYHNLHIEAAVRGKLADAISYNVKELVKMEDGTPLAIVAWHGRNLLELLIWTVYCIKSPENAARFAVDAIRDLDDLMKLVTQDEINAANPEDEQKFESFKSAHPTALAVMLGASSADVLNASRIVMTRIALKMATDACTMGITFGDELRRQLTEASAKG